MLIDGVIELPDDEEYVFSGVAELLCLRYVNPPMGMLSYGKCIECEVTTIRDGRRMKGCERYRQWTMPDELKSGFQVVYEAFERAEKRKYIKEIIGGIRDYRNEYLVREILNGGRR